MDLCFEHLWQRTGVDPAASAILHRATSGNSREERKNVVVAMVQYLESNNHLEMPRLHVGLEGMSSDSSEGTLSDAPLEGQQTDAADVMGAGSARGAETGALPPAGSSLRPQDDEPFGNDGGPVPMDWETSSPTMGPPTGPERQAPPLEPSATPILSASALGKVRDSIHLVCV